MTKIEEIMTDRKSPEDLKKGLECAITRKCIGESCPYFRPEMEFNPLNLNKEEYAENYSCIEKTRTEAYHYIRELEAKEGKIVHCRECKKYGPEPMGDVKMCYLTGNWPQPDDFCSMGERRTGKEEPYGTEAGEMPEAEGMDNKGPGEAEA